MTLKTSSPYNNNKLNIFLQCFFNNFLFSGWLFKVELSKPEELKDLLDENKYQAFLKTDQEAH